LEQWKVGWLEFDLYWISLNLDRLILDGIGSESTGLAIARGYNSVGGIFIAARNVVGKDGSVERIASIRPLIRKVTVR
jgi:hypothetical protein